MTGRFDILGIDFTSSPTRKKPITCIHCTLDDSTLRMQDFEKWPSFESFETALAKPGPWIAGIDFPFGQARRFVENIGWPPYWAEYVHHAGGLGRIGFREALNSYKQGRIAGDKEHRRATDKTAGSISPQKLHGVPVGLMFFEGAPRLLASGVTIPPPTGRRSATHRDRGLSRRARPPVHRSPQLQERHAEKANRRSARGPPRTAASPSQGGATALRFQHRCTRQPFLRRSRRRSSRRPTLCRPGSVGMAAAR